MRGKLGRRVVLAYGLPGFIAAVPVIPVAVLLPSWYAGDLGLGFFVTGVTLAIARIIDFSSDLLVGHYADRFDWRGYRYKPLVIAGAITAGCGLIALALPGTQPGPWWLGGWSVVLFTGWTLLMVPYTAWGAELSDDYHDRSRLTASRESAGLVGMLLALALPLAVTSVTGFTITPFVALAATAVVIGIPVIGVFALGVPEPRAEKSADRIRFADVAALARLPSFRHTLTCWWINGIANGLPAVLFPIVVETVFGLDESAMFRLLLCYFGAAVLGVPFWLRLSRGYGKISTWRIAIVVNILVFSQILLIEPANATAFSVICFFSGLTLGADLVLPPSIQADILGGDRRTSGRRRTASAFALWSMATKLALACAVFIAFAGIDIGRGTNTDPASAIILLLYVVIPVVLKGLVVVRLGRSTEDDLFRADTPAHGRD